MAVSAAGRRLTEEYRARQLAVRAGSLRQLVDLWRTVDPTNLGGTIGTFAQAAALLAGQGFDESASSALPYYRLFRTAEGVPGRAPAIPVARRPAASLLAGQLRGAALSGIINARRAGATPAGAASNGLVRVAGALAKLILTGGRATLMDAVREDPRAAGWGRVTTGGACAFCRMVASRGPTYKTEKSADFETHDGCGCTAEPVFERGAETLQSAAYRKEYNAAQAWARETGNMPKDTKNDSLNAYRRYLAAGKPTAGKAGTEGSGDG